MATSWTDQDKARLREMWPTEKTASEIADAFGDGRSRSAIIGKAHALGLPPKPANARRHVRVHLEDIDQDDPRQPKHARKAYAALGDDTTLTRFVKIKGEHAFGRRQFALPGLEPMNRAAIEGRSKFSAKGVRDPADLPHVLVSGHSNVKIGRDVRKGPLRGYWIYTLSLEERATCPRTCHHWLTCYGNNMPYAKRVRHGAELEAALQVEIPQLLAVKGRVGVLIRLHALGDFYSVDYVHAWRLLLAQHPRLAVYGYTAWPPDSDIGLAVGAMNRAYPGRSFIRYSNGKLEQNCTVSIRTPDQAPATAIICPEQVGKTAACATCGLCWHTQKNIAFIEH